MPYKPTGNPPGRPRKGQVEVANSTPPKVVTEKPPAPGSPPTGGGFVAIRAGGMDYLAQRAQMDGCTVDDVVRSALREYADRHPLHPAEHTFRPAPKPSAKKGS